MIESPAQIRTGTPPGSPCGGAEHELQLASLFSRREIHQSSKSMFADGATGYRVPKSQEGVNDFWVEPQEPQDLTDTGPRAMKRTGQVRGRRVPTVS